MAYPCSSWVTAQSKLRSRVTTLLQLSFIWQAKENTSSRHEGRLTPKTWREEKPLSQWFLVNKKFSILGHVNYYMYVWFFCYAAHEICLSTSCIPDTVLGATKQMVVKSVMGLNVSFYTFVSSPLSLPFVNWASQEGCLFYLWGSHSSPWTFLFLVFEGFPSFVF